MEANEIRITFSGGKRVEADLGLRVIRTDQSPSHGGDGTAPEPYDLFLASLGTCAGAYVLGFCQARAIPTTDIAIMQRNFFDDTGSRLERVELEIALPADFPDKYRGALVKAVEGCKVKRTLASPPETSLVTLSAITPHVSHIAKVDFPRCGAGDAEDGDACDEPT